jgi:hypothetical protein
MRLAPRTAIVVSILTLVVSFVGFMATLFLNVFVLDEYKSYGEVPIPGSTSLELPAGEMTVSFHTQVAGSPRSGFAIPDLSFGITPTGGLPEPTVVEDIGGTTTMNNDVRVRIWKVQIPESGTYEVEAKGAVDAFIGPKIAFGQDRSQGWLLFVFGGLAGLGLLELTASLLWSARVGKKARLLQPHELAADTPTWNPGPTPAAGTPTDQGVRLEQIRHLAALRDSGALTEDEYAAEKRRILDDSAG